MKLHILLFISLFIINSNEVLGSWGGSRHVSLTSSNSESYSSQRSNRYDAPYNKPQESYKDNPAKTTGRGLGVSAWGIVAIIVGAILTTAGVYYTFVFYPLLCKKERNYDKIELANV